MIKKRSWKRYPRSLKIIYTAFPSLYHKRKRKWQFDLLRTHLRGVMAR